MSQIIYYVKYTPRHTPHIRQLTAKSDAFQDWILLCHFTRVLPSKQRPMPALLNSAGTSSHSLGRTLCLGITCSHVSSSADIGFLCCTAGAECALESFTAATAVAPCDLNFPPLPNSGRLVATATAANRACAAAIAAVCCFAAMGLMEPLLEAEQPSSLLLPVVEGVHGSGVVPIG